MDMKDRDNGLHNQRAWKRYARGGAQGEGSSKIAWRLRRGARQGAKIEEVGSSRHREATTARSLPKRTPLTGGRRRSNAPGANEWHCFLFRSAVGGRLRGSKRKKQKQRWDAKGSTPAAKTGAMPGF